MRLIMRDYGTASAAVGPNTHNTLRDLLIYYRSSYHDTV